MSQSTMQRVRLLGDKSLDVEEVPRPEPGGDEVLVRMRASAICGTDLHALYRQTNESPCTPSHEFAGDVVAVAHATRVHVGDRVAIHSVPGCGDCRVCRMGAPIYCPYGNCPYGNCPYGNAGLGFARDGGDAEYVLVPEHCCLPLPDDLSYEVAALIGGGIGTPYHALCKAGGVRVGMTLGMFGLGPVGLGTTMLGAYFGASVIGVDINPRRLALAQQCGATHVINPTDDDPVAARWELTAGSRLDVAIECAPSAATVAYALETIGQFGHVALIGEHDHATFNPSSQFIGRVLTMSGSQYYHYADYDDILRIIASGLNPERVITHWFRLADAQQAFSLFYAGSAAEVILAR